MATLSQALFWDKDSHHLEDYILAGEAHSNELLYALCWKMENAMSGESS